jgi:hypothetical protein
MTDSAKTDSAQTEGPDAESPCRRTRPRAPMRGFPTPVAAAFAHASRAMSTLPAPFPALTAPAVTFDPATFTACPRRKRL